ncbi:MAG: hypothetical protein P8P49_10365 [Opitutales bacterium]|nr:hypothetical protein [Opitutales bacterium]
MSFIHFTDIDPSVPSTWQGKKVLSFDFDWAIDEILEDTLALIQQAEVKATMFVTHQTPVLEKMRESSLISMGLHPNFNPLLRGQTSLASPASIMSDLKEIVPEAKVLRSHSMTHSGLWLNSYKELGISHLSQYYMGAVKSIQPFKHVNGLVEVPVYFADDGYLVVNNHQEWSNPSLEEITSISTKAVKVYNFHPIHIALNSSSFTAYESTKSSHREWDSIMGNRSSSFGVRDILKRIIQEQK